VIGKTMTLSGDSYVIIGILNESPNVRVLEPNPDVWIPFQLDPNSSDQGHFFQALGRLKPGVGREQARGAFEAVALDVEQGRRLLLALQEAGFIETRKGAGLGSRLSRPASRISLAEVYRAVETDEPFALHSKRPNQACPVGHCIQAALERIFTSAEDALERELAKTNLADILKSVQASCSRSRKDSK
jgi:DNA-binding IscR family transcriptional regulator